MGTNGNKRELFQKQRLAALLISVGLNQTETAKIIAVQPKTVTRWKRKQSFAAFLAKKIAEVESKVEGARDILLEAAGG